MKKSLVPTVPTVLMLLLGSWCGGCSGDFFPPQRVKGRPETVIWPKNTPQIPENKPKKAKPKPVTVATETPNATGGSSGGTYLIKNAAVEEVDVLVMESYPQQIMAVVTGTLPDKATELDEVEQTREGSTIRLILTTKRERAAQATMALIPFKKNIPVTTDGLEEGTYQLDVNGVKKSFSFLGKGKGTMTPTLNSNPSSLPPPVELPPPAAPMDIPVVLEPEMPPATEAEKPVETVPAPPLERRPIAPVAPGVVLPN